MRRWNFIQNLLIVLLSVSALALFSRTQFFQQGSSAVTGSWARLSTPPAAAEDTDLSDGLTAPVHLAVTGEYGRYGSVTLTTDSETFTPVKTLLREVLGSARNRTACTQPEFLSALERAAVYCDFLSPLPVVYLADLMGVSLESTITVRSLIAAEQDGQVVLLLWDGADTFYRCATALQPSALTEVLNLFPLGVSTFAFEEEAGHALAPCSLFPDPLPELPQLSADSTPPSSGAVLTVLGFNPHTNSRYLESGGTEVVVEGDRSLRIGTDGLLSYSGGDENRLSIDAAGPTPTLREAAAGAQALLERMTPGGDARLFLHAIRQEDEETTLSFGYQFSGVPILFSDGRPAAEVTLSGTTVSAFTLQLRYYTAADQTSLLLPLTQAMAAAAQEAGAELMIGYADTGAETLSAGWLAEHPD